MACKCGSERIMSVMGKTNDMCAVSYQGHTHHGYVPRDVNIGGGDYISFKICLDCGTVQGKWPIADEQVIPEEESDY